MEGTGCKKKWNRISSLIDLFKKTRYTLTIQQSNVRVSFKTNSLEGLLHSHLTHSVKLVFMTIMLNLKIIFFSPFDSTKPYIEWIVILILQNLCFFNF